MVTLSDNFPIRKAGSVYATAENESDLLPVVYGDLRYGSGGVWPCPCIDTTLFKYCVADCIINTSNVTLYDGDTITTSYTLSTAGGITIATFSSKPTGAISARGTGKTVDGVLLTNPADILLDILDVAGYDTDNGIDWYIWNQATAQADSAGLTAAGVILQERTLQELATELLTSFLGDMWATPERGLQLAFDVTAITSFELAGIISERNIKDPQAEQNLENVCNQAECYFAPALVKSDRRFSEGGQTDFLGYDDGDDSKDAISQAQYGQRVKPFELRWIYNRTVANAIQARIVERFARPLWTITLTELGSQNVHVEMGQYIVFSWRGLCDADERPLRNQIGRVLSKRMLLNSQSIEWSLVDTGYWLSYPPASLDGAMLLDGATTLGGQRNQEKL